MTTLHFSRLIILVAIMPFVFSCMNASKFARNANIDVTKVPNGFNPDKHILLVSELPRIRKPKEKSNYATKKLDKALKKYCPYRYEIVSPQDIISTKGKYADTSVYKYAIVHSMSSYTRGHTSTTTVNSNSGTSSFSVSPSANTTSVDFGFFDRAAGYQYPNSGNSSPSVGYAMAAFMEVVKKAKGTN